MLDFKLISTIVGLFAGIGIMVGGCGYTYSTWKNGKNKYKDEFIADLKQALAIEKEKVESLNSEKSKLITEHQEKLADLQKQLTELQVIVGVQKAKLDEYTSILENRDPQTLKLLTDIKTGIDSLNKHHIVQDKALIVAADKVESNKI